MTTPLLDYIKTLRRYFFPHDHKPDHFKALDGLRGLAILMVLLSHSSNEHVEISYYFRFPGIGIHGVFLFFVLSSYLLDRQIGKALLEYRANKRFWLNYFLRRFLRIYPLFLLALLFDLWLTNNQIPYGMGVNNSDFVDHLLLQRGRGVFWSIPVEFKYYFLSPLIVLLFRWIFKWRLAGIVFIIILLTTLSITYNAWMEPQRISTIRHLPLFLMGTFLAIFELLHKKKMEQWSSGLRRLFDTGGWVAILLVFFTFMHFINLIFGTVYSRDTFHGWEYYVPLALCWGMVLFASKNGAGFWRKVFEFPPLRFLGTISYSLYLFHIPILYFTIDQDWLPDYLKFWWFMVLCILLGIISFFLIERPLSMVRLKENKSILNTIKN